jgi:DNA-binding NarL/FixJ family response regulator
MEKIKIILVDDNIKFRDSIKDLLTNVCKYNVIAEASNGEEFLKIPKTLKPDVILMNLAMPEVDGFEATRQYNWDFPNSKIIAVTNHVEKAYLLKLIETGFKGCIFKYSIFNEVQPAIKAVMSGELWFPSEYKIDGVS